MDENVYVENFPVRLLLKVFKNNVGHGASVVYEIDKRLALFLIDESENLGSDVINLTHEQIARYTSSAREVYQEC